MTVRAALRRIAAATAGVAALSIVCLPQADALAQPPVPCDGAITTVIDEQGVEHEACVAQLAAPLVTAPQVAAAPPGVAPKPALPRTGSDSRTGIIIAAVLVVIGVATSLFARHRS